MKIRNLASKVVCALAIVGSVLSKASPAQAGGEDFFRARVVNTDCAKAASKYHPVPVGTACIIRVASSVSPSPYWLQFQSGDGVWHSSPTRHRWTIGTPHVREDFRFRVARSQNYRVVTIAPEHISIPGGPITNEFRINVK